MKQFNLSIPTPCHEDWNQMTPKEQGRFCASCQKQVVDFTTMSDQQLAAYFKKNPSNTCGRFMADQLERDIVIPTKRIPWLRYFFQFTLPAFLLSLKANSQKIERVEKVSVVRGLRDTIINKSNQEVVPDKLINSGAIDPTAVPASLTGSVGGVVIVAGGISIRPKKEKKPFSLINNTKRDTAFNQFSVYPNPARSNGTITIDCKKMNKGEYTLQVMAVGGTSVCMKPLVLEQKGGLLRTDLPTLVPGQYIITLLHKKTNKVYTEKIQVL